jgi:hypothetical protein
MIMQGVRRAGHASLNRKADFTPSPARSRAGCLPADTGRRKTVSPYMALHPFFRPHHAANCFLVCFLAPLRHASVARLLRAIRQPPRAENIMKLQLGQKQLVLEFSKSPFAWFQGRTERMRLTSLSLLFVRFSVFARQPTA